MRDRQHADAERKTTSAAARGTRQQSAGNDTSAPQVAVMSYQQARLNPGSLTPAAVLALQRTAGNAAVNQLMRQYGTRQTRMAQCSAEPGQQAGDPRATPEVGGPTSHGVAACINRKREVGAPPHVTTHTDTEAFHSSLAGVRVYTTSSADALIRSAGAYQPGASSGNQLQGYERGLAASAGPKAPTLQRGLLQATRGKTKSPKDEFLSRTYSLKGFTPSTGIGNFDVEYNPKSGEMRVVVKVSFTFKDVDVAWQSEVKNEQDRRWTKQAKTQWIAEFKSQILSVWGSIPQLRCTKPGFDGIVAQPRIVITEVSNKKKTNYNIIVDKAFATTQGKMRTSGGSTSVGSAEDPKEASFQEHDNKDKINDPRVRDHLKGTEQTTNITPAYQRDRERLIARLGGIGSIGFMPGTAMLSPAEGPRLASGAQQLATLGRDSALAHLHPIVVTLALLATEPPTLAQERLAVIQHALTAAGVRQAVTSTTNIATAPTATLETGPDDGAVSTAYVTNWKRITVAHEFGHMLGLLDEYCPAISPELLQMMVDEGRLDPGYVMSSQAQRRPASDSAKQTAYTKMLKKNNLTSPTWARPTASGQEKSTSLMSGGFEVLTQHYVTIWEALGAATSGAGLDHTDWSLG